MLLVDFYDEIGGLVESGGCTPAEARRFVLWSAVEDGVKVTLGMPEVSTRMLALIRELKAALEAMEEL